MKRLMILAGLALMGPAGAVAQCYVAREGVPFDFIPGQRAIFDTDFSTSPLGEFPAGLELKTGAMDVVMWRGQRALKASSASAFVVPLSAPLPQNFTVELSVVNRNTRQMGASTVKIYGGRTVVPDGSLSATRASYGPLDWEIVGGGASGKADFSMGDRDACVGQEVTIRLQVDGARAKLYADDRRLGSVPNANFLRGTGLVIELVAADDMDNAVYLTRLRVASAQTIADTRAVGSAGVSGGSIQPPVATIAQPPADQTPPPVSTTPPVSATPPVSVAPPANQTNGNVRGQAPGRAATTGTTNARSLSTGTENAHAAPTGVIAKAVGEGRVALVWNPVPGATSYNVVYKGPNMAPAGANLEPITESQHVTRALAEGAVEITVLASFGDGEPTTTSTPITVNVPKYIGRYRVTVNGFKVNAETFDNPAQLDGKHDEVYVRATVQEFQDGSATAAPRTAETKTHGDVNHPRWQSSALPGYRIKAGSASTLGGLVTGNGFPSADPWQRASAADYTFTFPLLVWEGTLVGGFNSTMITPVLYEADEMPEMQPPELKLFESFLKPASKLVQVQKEELVGNAKLKVTKWFEPIRAAVYKPSPMLLDTMSVGTFGAGQGIPLAELNAALQPLLQSLRTGMTNFASATFAAVSVMNNAKDRPIGVEVNASGQLVFYPHVLNLSYERAEQIINGQGSGVERPGIVALRYRDNLPGGTGDYTLYVQVQRIP